MVGKNHLISATSSLIIAGNIVAYFDSLSGKQTLVADNSLESIIAQCAHNVKEFMIPSDWKIPLVILAGIFLVCYYLGTLLPDIDNENSFLGRFIHIPVQHRTWTHTIWCVILFAVLGIFIRPFMWLACGYFIHLFWDSFSACGVCWFYPFQKYISYGSGAMVKKGHILKLYHTGKTSEKIFVSINAIPGVMLLMYDIFVVVLTVGAGVGLFVAFWE